MAYEVTNSEGVRAGVSVVIPTPHEEDRPPRIRERYLPWPIGVRLVKSSSGCGVATKLSQRLLNDVIPVPSFETLLISTSFCTHRSPAGGLPSFGGSDSRGPSVPRKITSPACPLYCNRHSFPDALEATGPLNPVRRTR